MCKYSIKYRTNGNILNLHLAWFFFFIYLKQKKMEIRHCLSIIAHSADDENLGRHKHKICSKILNFVYLKFKLVLFFSE